MYTLVLGENNAADQTKAMQDQMSGAALSMPDDLNKAFKVKIILCISNHSNKGVDYFENNKAESENLMVTQHNWFVKEAELRVLGKELDE
jgi:hypothetical protein